MSILEVFWLFFFHGWEAKACDQKVCFTVTVIYFGAELILKVLQHVLLFAECQHIWPSQTSLSTGKPFTVMVFWLTGTLFWERHVDVECLNAIFQCFEQHKIITFTSNVLQQISLEIWVDLGITTTRIDCFSAILKYPLDVSREMCFILLKASKHKSCNCLERKINWQTFKNS